MKISRTGEEYADALFREEANVFLEIGNKQLSWTAFDDNADADYQTRVKIAARLAEARIRSYVSAFEREHLTIADEDLKEIIARAQEVIRGQAGELFRIGAGLAAMRRSSLPDFQQWQVRQSFERQALASAQSVIDELYLKMKEHQVDKKGKVNMERYYRVLKWIYDNANGQRYRPVDLRDLIAKDETLAANDVEKASDWLNDEGLISQQDDSGMLVLLQHPGIKEIEQSVRDPNVGTEHFSPSIIQHFHAPVGSVQTGDYNIANVQQNFGTNTDDLLRLIDELKSHLLPETQDEAMEYIEALENEVKSGEPKQTNVKAYLKVLGGFVQKAGESLLIELGKQLILGSS